MMGYKSPNSCNEKQWKVIFSDSNWEKVENMPIRVLMERRGCEAGIGVGRGHEGHVYMYLQKRFRS